MEDRTTLAMQLVESVGMNSNDSLSLNFERAYMKPNKEYPCVWVGIARSCFSGNVLCAGFLEIL
jgi:hypothetical protein